MPITFRTMRSTFFLIPFLSLFITGCAVLGFSRIPSDPVERLQNSIESVLRDSSMAATVASVRVVSLDRTSTLFELNSDLVMRPASNMKLLTAVTAIHSLGKDFRFITGVYADSVDFLRHSALDLCLKGGGDPDLTSDDLDSLASTVKAMGIDTVRRWLSVDTSYFDGGYWGAGWMWDDESDPDGAAVSPISVNKNCVTVTIQVDSLNSECTRYVLSPSTSYVTVVNRSVVVQETVVSPLVVSRGTIERSNLITIDGQILAGSPPQSIRVAVWHPELYAAQLFGDALRKHGVWVPHDPILATAAPSAREIALHVQRLDSTVVNLLKISDNLSAEAVLKTTASVLFGPPGTTSGGIMAVRKYLASFGIDTTRFLMVDGSGLSHYNLLTTRMISQLLAGISRDTGLFPIIYNSLPIAGVDGTLRSRMKATAAEGNLRAKTGSLSGVSSLSGYVRSRDGERLAFSIMMQSFIGSASHYRDIQDKIGALLASFGRTHEAARSQ
jgi:D-alanyl-D-alanine carboxypeptidase/D-alanyl-D-alanine-endopeptidase (penicillin-binding protein 4)